jgi:hypothetical protein
MTTPQPSPSSEFSQPSSSGQGMEPYAAMMGVQQQQQRPGMNNAEQMRRQQLESLGGQVRSIGQMLDGIAKQFPDASQEVQMLKAGLTRVLVKVVGSSSPESQVPTGDLG